MSMLSCPHYDRIDWLAAVKIFLDVGLDWLAVSVGSGCRWISWIPLRRVFAVSTGAWKLRLVANLSPHWAVPLASSMTGALARGHARCLRYSIFNVAG
jgi:hypothetical protein